MKKIALMLILVLVLGVTVARAEIKQGKDSFSGGTWYVSGNYLSQSTDWLGLRKLIEGNNVSYEIMYSEETLSYIKFTNQAAEIKIDDAQIQELNIKEKSSRPTIHSGISFIRVSLILPQERAAEISKAKRVALRIHKENSTPYVYVLPDAVLAEWKEVINTEK